MSVELVCAEIARFLKDAKPEVLCIRGKWGVGKSYAWTEQLKAAQKAKQLGLLKYSKVSLFGLNSLDALKYAVFEGSQNVGESIQIPSFETLEDFVGKLPRWKEFIKPLLSGSWAGRVIGSDGALSLSFMAVRDQIVCIDDFERRSKNLELIDVFGLVSFLREQRNCKVVLILNEERLDDADKREFERHLEKVVDVSLSYEPTPERSARIGVDSADEVGAYIADRCVALGITNIRVIKRIVQFVETVRPKLNGYDGMVMRTAISSLALFTWSHDQPDEAPQLGYLESKTLRNFALRPGGDQALDRADESGWKSALIAYGYMSTSEFDLVLIEAVRKGYFDDEKLKSEASKLSAKFAAAKGRQSIDDAWRKFITRSRMTRMTCSMAFSTRFRRTSNISPQET